jgi:multiple sugar transport system substrate-binding protein
LFSTAGVSAPTTYEELLAVVPKLTVRDGNTIVTSAIALGTSTNIEHFSDIVSLMILQNGGSLSNPTVKETEEAVSFYRKFASPGDPMYTWNSLLDNSLSAFASGRLAMMIAPSWRAFDVAAINPNLKFKIEPVPQLPGTQVTWASYWVEGVSSKSKNQRQAMQFLKFLTSKESVVKMYDEASKTRLFGEPYARVELGSRLLPDQFAGAYIKQAQTAQSFPTASKTHDAGLNDRMVKYMEDAITSMTENTAPQKALSTMAQGFAQVLGTFGLQSAQAP